MPKQLLVIKPSAQLTFYAPFDNRCCSHLEVTNPSPYAVCYKVRTTASNRYGVKPNMGLILPYSHQTLIFRLRNGIGDKCDKFKILSGISPNINCADVRKIWDKIPEENIMETKVAVNFIGEWKSHDAVSTIQNKERTSSWRDAISIYILFIIGYFLISFLFITNSITNF
ncbi:hypothetical protein O3M35_005427 [Rhynocoris fuscipes]|uniref:MSP domain-containing protein n=1 Tax=Rhynocoris fuscipes TaxID=488301 RepID=A0AAW1DIL6_9HEMI